MPFLPHLGQRYSPRFFATLLAQVLSHLQHFWHKWVSLVQHPRRSWCPCNTPDTRSWCLLQHLCRVRTPATPLLQLVSPATSLQCTFRNSVEHQQHLLDLPDARSWAAPDQVKRCGPSGQAAWTVYHEQNHALLGQPGGLPCWASPLAFGLTRNGGGMQDAGDNGKKVCGHLYPFLFPWFSCSSVFFLYR